MDNYEREMILEAIGRHRECDKAVTISVPIMGWVDEYDETLMDKEDSATITVELQERLSLHGAMLPLYKIKYITEYEMTRNDYEYALKSNRDYVI